MGDESPGQPIDAWIAAQVTLSQLRQLSVEATWQVITNLAQLFVDNVVIVDQPLRPRCDRALLADCLGDCTIRFEQHPPVVENARQQRAAFPRRGRHALGGGKALTVLLKSLRAEEFSPNRFFERRKGDGL